MVSLVGLLAVLPFKRYLPGIASDGAVSIEPQRIPPVGERFLKAMNTVRAGGGLEPYWWNEKAARAAQARVADMVARDYFSHKTPEGTSGYVEELWKQGVTNFTLAGENLAMNNFAFNESVERAMVTLMASPTHRDNIMDTTFESVGVGWAEGPTGVFRYCTIFLSGVAP